MENNKENVHTDFKMFADTNYEDQLLINNLKSTFNLHMSQVCIGWQTYSAIQYFSSTHSDLVQYQSLPGFY